ncbi:hypothetical protein Dimus_027368 [Dionaea muscipula]
MPARPSSPIPCTNLLLLSPSIRLLGGILDQLPASAADHHLPARRPTTTSPCSNLSFSPLQHLCFMRLKMRDLTRSGQLHDLGLQLVNMGLSPLWFPFEIVDGLKPVNLASLSY